MLWALPAGAIFQALDHLYIFRYTLLGKKQPPIPLIILLEKSQIILKKQNANQILICVL
jgi:hypothetical protein